MIIYILVYIYHLFFNKINSKILLLVSFISLVLICGLRSVDVGTDTQNYLNSFLLIKGNNLVQAEPVYILLAKFVNLFNGDFTAFLIVYSFLTLLPIYYLANKNKEPILFLLFFIGLFYYFNGFNIMRQSLSASYIGLGLYLLYIDDNLSKKKILLGLFSLLIGFSSHYISLIVIPFLILFHILRRIKNTDVHLFILFISYIIGISFHNMFTLFGAGIVGYDLESSSFSFFGNSMLVLIQFVIFSVSAKFLIKSKDNLYYLYLCYMIFFIVTIRIPYNSRLVLPFMIIVIMFYLSLVQESKVINNKKSIPYLFFMLYLALNYFMMLNDNFGEIIPYKIK